MNKEISRAWYRLRKITCSSNNNEDDINRQIRNKLQDRKEISFDENLFTLYVYTDILEMRILRDFDHYLYKCQKIFALKEFKKQFPDQKVTIKISTNGGDVNVRFAMHDLIIVGGLPVVTVAVG